MELWNEIIHTAMLGTDKKNIVAEGLSDDFINAATIINSNETIDKEEKFLQLASVVFNYRQSGTLPLHKEQVDLQVAPAEEKEYCSTEAMQALKDIVSEESIPLLKYWLQLCNIHRQIVQASIIPSLFAIAAQQKTVQVLIAACCGKRGEWLARLNDAWNFSVSDTPEELWQTGTLEQRKNILKETRKTNPALAREWLVKTWQQEDAAARTSFLELLIENISEDDMPFLEQALTDKSKKVKEEALDLLKRIPLSSIIQLYQQVIEQTISLKKEKALLGLSSKTAIDISLPSVVNEEIFKTGIQKLSSQKNVSDESYIVYQLLSFVPPSFLEKHLNIQVFEIINLLRNSKEAKDFLPAIGLATGRFKDKAWAAEIIKDDVNLYFDLLPLLKDDAREKYLLSHFTNSADIIINSIINDDKEWSVEITRQVFRHTAKNPYQYNRAFYNTHIHLLPVQIADELEKYSPQEEHIKANWNNIRDYIMKLIALKSQTNKAFIK